MHSTTPLLPLLFSLALASPTPTLHKRASEQCGQYQSQSSGIYTLATNGWGWSSASPAPSSNGPSGTTGNGQCSEIDSLSGSTISWDTDWTWAGTANQVKSYTNVQTWCTQKQLSAYSSIPTTWDWSYTGTNLRCNGTVSPPPCPCPVLNQPADLTHI